MPVQGILPVAGNWLTGAMRGLLAMAPPPQASAPPGFPCPGVPQPLFTGSPSPTATQMLWCAPCIYDNTKLCSYVDQDGDGSPDPGEIPLNFRGFDDPQADPAAGLIFVQTVWVKYVRADLFSLPPVFEADDTLTGNPPWGSQVGDGDADTNPDALADRHNQGSFAANLNTDVVPQRAQQFSNDAFAEVSCPFPPLANPCDPFLVDCGGIAKYATAAPTGYDPYPGPTDPPSPADWPVIPFPRDWAPFKSTDSDSIAAIKRLLRFTTAIVSYDSTQPHMQEYSLAEDARNVMVTAPGTPLAGALLDAYHYFVNSVFPQTDDPAINCRNYIVVLMTDGFDECKSNPCVGGSTGLGSAGDLGAVVLPENPAGARALAHAADPTIRVTGVPVYVIAMNSNPNDPRLQCIADNSGGQIFPANDRASIVNALQSILEFKRTANVIAAPGLPAFAGGVGDSAQFGAVIPSHTNIDSSASQWSIWTGSLKSFTLDANGNIPVVTGLPPTATATPTPGGPTPVPATATPTGGPVPNPNAGFPDETNPDDVVASTRRPAWNAARVLGYTDPVAVLTNAAAPIAANPVANAPAITVWPGRKMVWASTVGPTVPLARQEFVPDTGVCSGICFDGIATAMGLNPAVPADRTLAIETVQFLRGGVTSYGSRDEILNIPAISPPGSPVGPGVGQQQRYSYFFQDDQPAPGAPQIRTDSASSPPGYSHKLGDIFHSEPELLDVPSYFQYLSADLTPLPGQSYTAFAALQAMRRRVVFVGANDGFLHAFDAGVWNRDTVGYPGTFDLGTGREIFAYAPRGVMTEEPKLLSFPPRPQYFVDGLLSFADVFMDPSHNGTPTPANRVWKTILVGSLRQGGDWIYGLDVTQPDRIDSTGNKIAAPDTAPDCLDGGGTCPNQYPTVLWEVTDDSTLSPATSLGLPAMGQTWSKPVVGRIQLVNGGSLEDHYVAIFGGGYDATFNPGDPIVTSGVKATRGRSIYVLDVETGKVIYKASQGMDSTAGLTNFAPMPSSPGVSDYDDDGYLDVVYIGDVNGRMWRLDLGADATSIPKKGDLVAGQVQGWMPILLYDASTMTTQPTQPMFLEPSLVYLAGGSRPTLGVAFGTGNRAELLKVPNPSVNRFFYIIDNGGTTTLHESDLRNLTPAGGVTAQGVGPGQSTYGYFLDFATQNEKTTSSVLSTFGYLTLVTFTPDSNNPCATEGSSYRYRIFFLDGSNGYNIGAPNGGSAQGDISNYRESMGEGLATETQTTHSGALGADAGAVTNYSVEANGELGPDTTRGSQRTINQNWKEINP